jgi:hypothetical protein
VSFEEVPVCPPTMRCVRCCFPISTFLDATSPGFGCRVPRSIRSRFGSSSFRYHVKRREARTAVGVVSMFMSWSQDRLARRRLALHKAGSLQLLEEKTPIDMLRPGKYSPLLPAGGSCCRLSNHLTLPYPVLSMSTPTMHASS